MSYRKDALQLQQLIQSAFHAGDSGKMWAADMGLSSWFYVKLDNVETSIARTDGGILVAINNGILVRSEEVRKRDTNLARLALLAVDKDYQREGIGRQLVAYA